MNKIYSLLGIGLLTAAALSSCSEDVIMDEGRQVPQGELGAYTTVASIQGYKTTEKEPSTRANVQEDGRSFMWNTDDAVTIWNGTNGYNFTSVSYDDSEPSKNVEFTGNGTFTEGATVWGIYPKKDSPTTADAFTFTLADNVTQSGDKPELQSTMHMLAKGTVNGTTVTNLNFEHLTALYQFSIRNLRPDDYKIKSVTVSCETAIFPKTLTVSGEEKTYSDKVISRTLNLSNLEIAKNAIAHGYMNFFPMPDMAEDTELTFTVTVQKGSEEPETIEKKGKVSELYDAESVVAGDGYKYMAGKRYGVSFALVAELGYEETEPNKYLVTKEEGLINLASDLTIIGNAATVITLNKDLDWTGKEAWTPITEFKGIFDGNNKKISNLTIQDNAGGMGLFAKNSGTIKNLTLEDITINSATATTIGAFAATNSGIIQACTVNGGTFTANANNTAMGAFAGINNVAGAAIIDCRLEGNATLTVANGVKADFGGLVGTNGNWNAPNIKGSSVDKTVTLVYNGTNTGSVGGLVGWNKGGVITGSYALPVICLNTAANAGGLVGAHNNNSKLIASYAAGSITAPIPSGSRVGGLISNNGPATVTACYSTITITSGTKIGGLFGEWNAAASISECYFMNSDNASGGTAIASGASKVDSADELRGKAASMNTAVADSGFEFTANPADDNAPLSIRKIE